MDQMLTTGEVWQVLHDAGFGDSLRSITRMIDNGVLRGYRLETSGNHRRVPAGEVARLIARRRGQLADVGPDA
jgi:hypothetical protein